MRPPFTLPQSPNNHSPAAAEPPGCPHLALISLGAAASIAGGRPGCQTGSAAHFWLMRNFLSPAPGQVFFLAPVSLPHLCLRHGSLSQGGPRATSRPLASATTTVLARPQQNPLSMPSPEDGVTRSLAKPKLR